MSDQISETAETRSGVQMGIDFKEWPLQRRYETAALWNFVMWSNLMWHMLVNEGFDTIEKSVREMGTGLANKAVLRTLEMLNVKGNHAMSAASFFWLADQLAFGGIGFIIKELTPRHVLAVQAPFGKCFCFDKEINVDPIDVPELPKLCMAYTDYERTACRLVNPALEYRINKLVSRGDDSCEVEFHLPEPNELKFDERKPGMRTGLQQGIHWEEWPLDRRYKSAARWSSLWFACTTWRLLENVGFAKIEKSLIEGQQKLAEYRMRTMFPQLGIPGKDVGSMLNYFLLSEQIGSNAEVELVELTPKRAVYRKLQPKHGGCWLHDPNFTAHPRDIPECRKFCEAYTAYDAECCRIHNPHIKFTLGDTISTGAPYCEYILEISDD